MGARRAATLKLTNLDKVLFPAADGERAASPSATSSATTPRSAPCDAAVPRRPAGQPATGSPTASTSPGFWHKERPSHAPDWLTPVALRRRRRGRDASGTSWSTRPPRWPGWPTTARVELHPWTSRSRDAARADVGADRHRPRAPKTTFDDVRRAGPPLPHRARAPRRAGRPEGHRQAGHPDLGARSPTATRSTTPAAWVETRVAGGRRDRARAGQLGVDEGRPRAAWPASTTPRTRSTRRWSRRSAPARRRVRRCRCRSRGTSSTTPTSRPTAGRSAPSSTGSPRPATRSAPHRRAAGPPRSRLTRFGVRIFSVSENPHAKCRWGGDLRHAGCVRAPRSGRIGYREVTA